MVTKLIEDRTIIVTNNHTDPFERSKNEWNND